MAAEGAEDVVEVGGLVDGVVAAEMEFADFDVLREGFKATEGGGASREGG